MHLCQIYIRLPGSTTHRIRSLLAQNPLLLLRLRLRCSSTRPLLTLSTGALMELSSTVSLLSAFTGSHALDASAAGAKVVLSSFYKMPWLALLKKSAAIEIIIIWASRPLVRQICHPKPSSRS